MHTCNLLALDLGAESGRAVVGRFDGTRIALEEVHRFANVPVRALDTLHWDVLRLWHDIKTGIGKCVQSAGKPMSMGVDTWGVDFGFIGEDGSLLANPVHYRDARTDGMLEAAYELAPREEIYEVTGLQFLKLNSLFQLLSLARNAKSKMLSTAQSLLFIPDLFNYWLTGVVGAEYTIASTSQALDARSRQWATSLLARLGIPTTIFPEVLETGTRLGPVLGSVGAETGAQGMKVIASAGHDTASAVAAVPAAGSGWCYISSGTWSLMGAEIDQPAINAETLAHNFTNEGGVAGTIRFLKNIMGLWLVQQCRKSFERRGASYDYATLTRLAAEAPAGGPAVDPNHDSFLNPDDMPTAIREFCQRTGQPAPDSDGGIVKCCLDSLALCYRKTLMTLEKLLGERFDTIHIVGGGSQNRLLCQLTADCTGRRVVAGPVEATALGNCLVQLIAGGEIGRLADARQVVRSSFPTEDFESREKADWDERFAEYERVTRV